MLVTFSGCWMDVGCITRVLDGVLDAFLGCWMHFQGVGWGVGCFFKVLDAFTGLCFGQHRVG